MDDIDQLRNTQGTIFNIQYFCIHDGPGIRTTVFFKGCPLSCIWCHNPEGISKKRLFSYIDNKCVRCGECARICPEAHRFIGNTHELIWDECPDELIDCSAESCVARALTVVGEHVTAGAVMEKVNRDRRFYAEGGGVTFSGGEPTMQKEFLAALLKLASSDGLHTVVETCGLCDFEYYESIMPYVDIFYYDYKETNPDKHREYTKAGNALIIENIRRLHDAGAAVLLRCPIVPEINDRDEHFMGIADLTIRHPKLLGAEILPYHKLASAKAGRMGLRAQAEYAQPVPETAELWRERVRSFGGRIVET